MQFFWFLYASFVLTASHSLFLAVNRYDVVIWLSLLGSIIFIPFLVKNLKIQQIHRPKSWIYYFIGIYWVLFLVGCVVFFYNFDFLWITWRNWKEYLYALIIGIYLLGIFVITLCSFCCKKTSVPQGIQRFAPESVDSNHDELGFALSARNTARAFQELEAYVGVSAIFGGLGWGKSSFARMITENFDSKSTLYSYISLTETNAEKDFSALFSQRWAETLAERYPKLNITQTVDLIYSLLRESDLSGYMHCMRLISHVNTPLEHTKKVIGDNSADNLSSIVPKTIAKAFWNIPEIKEKIWIIMIDEIERAKLCEVYRAIEIIERFKYEGRTGLPVQILFILCIDDEKLKDRLKKLTDQDENADLISDFLFENPKNINCGVFFLPPVDSEIKRKFIKLNVAQWIKKFNLQHRTI